MLLHQNVTHTDMLYSVGIVFVLRMHTLELLLYFKGLIRVVLM